MAEISHVLQYQREGESSFSQIVKDKHSQSVPVRMKVRWCPQLQWGICLHGGVGGAWSPALFSKVRHRHERSSRIVRVWTDDVSITVSIVTLSCIESGTLVLHWCCSGCSHPPPLRWAWNVSAAFGLIGTEVMRSWFLLHMSLCIRIGITACHSATNQNHLTAKSTDPFIIGPEESNLAKPAGNWL